MGCMIGGEDGDPPICNRISYGIPVTRFFDCRVAFDQRAKSGVTQILKPKVMNTGFGSYSVIARLKKL